MATSKNGLKSSADLKASLKKQRKVAVSAVSSVRKDVRKRVQKRVKKAANNLKNLNLPTVRSKKSKNTTKPKITKEQLINAESDLGGKLFGPIPAGHQREFFLYRQNYWIYHENWIEKGRKKESTITFEVRKNGVYKNPLGSGYRKIEGAELKNFCLAAKEYQKLVKAKLYMI